MYVNRVSMLTSDYMVAPGNGLPELHLDPLDPIDHITQEIAARTPAVEAGVKDYLQEKIKSATGVTQLQQQLKGLAAALALAAVGIVVLFFGGYLLTKD